MGGKESKLTCISYEDAVKRVSDADLKRLREAAKRLGNASGTISRQTFFHDVLGDNVPASQAEIIYTACSGGQKGISFKDLLCGLVVITRGTAEEKIKLLFNVYAGEGGQFITRTSMLKVVQQCEGKTNVDGFRALFKSEERVGYSEYRDWVQLYSHATELSTWLLSGDSGLKLSDDLETPTFYQSLAGVTHLEEREILELEHKYWSLKAQSRSGRFDRELLAPLVTPPLPEQMLDGFFNAFDENRDGHIDFKEMACGISASCRGPQLERQKFCFKVFDGDRDGRLSESEVRLMVDALHAMSAEVSPAETDALVTRILSGSENGTHLTQEEYLMWTLDNPLADYCPSLLFQVCHVVLGLKPRTRLEEADIVLGWLCRQESLGYRVGALWYLVNMAWWNAWTDYVNYQPEAGPAAGAAVSQTSLGSTSSGHSTLTRSHSRDKKCKADAVVANDVGPVVVTSVKTLSENPSADCLRPRQGGLRSAASTVSITGLERAGTPSPAPSPNPSRKLTPGAVPAAPPRPGAVDNLPLVQTPANKVTNLTGEGGRLRTDVTLTRGRDFELVPESLWKALVQWYGGAPGLPRQVIQPSPGVSLELELYPINLRLLRHQAAPAARGAQTSWSGSVGGYSGVPLVDVSSYSNMLSGSTAPKRYLAYTAAFSRQATVRQLYDFLGSRLRLRPEDTRLWHVRDENNMVLWEDETPTLEQLRVLDNDQVLIEVRNKDQTWPEEMSTIANLSRAQAAKHRLDLENG
ncbi:Ubiquitin carboxyl-terminal hydrolase 32 [Amphibalanus amphitrite]|uniref:Ubiquitin carboxyl-terminal hydrolase 32 n=1 Tax=Amphibalanus amphitrite TaxID=1232801 RepID=A0A6A4W009_AMPAM|nr:Ubiquitin carboxyl-terminal hydrolase 32 [Amphibalanus amphitrite]